MIYKNIAASENLSHLVKGFWMVDSESDSTICREKIIPDGYPEMIFHYGDVYRANISGQWHTQEHYLIAGQIYNHFYLENTGVSGMIGIKFQPWAIKELFDIDMSGIVNKVISIADHLNDIFDPLIQIACNRLSFEEKIVCLENHLRSLDKPPSSSIAKYRKVVSTIIDTKGAEPLARIREKYGIHERSLERYFKTYIGLSPKHYSRIIRFSNVFKLVERCDFDWSAITYLSGYYDQSHFIKNFKEFTGEEPSKYGFNDVNMANLFLNPNE